MSALDEHLKQYLREQIALEEHLCSVIRQQIAELGDADEDAKLLLIKTEEVLERHFIPLNKMLDGLEQESRNAQNKLAIKDGVVIAASVGKEALQRQRTSRILRDDYSALNLITMSNTLLHTTALALDSQEVAMVALTHLQNLAPLVVKMGALVPEIVTRELHTESSKIDLGVAKIALKNTQRIWREA